MLLKNIIRRSLNHTPVVFSKGYFSPRFFSKTFGGDSFKTDLFNLFKNIKISHSIAVRDIIEEMETHLKGLERADESIDFFLSSKHSLDSMHDILILLTKYYDVEIYPPREHSLQYDVRISMPGFGTPECRAPLFTGPSYTNSLEHVDTTEIDQIKEILYRPREQGALLTAEERRRIDVACNRIWGRLLYTVYPASAPGQPLSTDNKSQNISTTQDALSDDVISEPPGLKKR